MKRRTFIQSIAALVGLRAVARRAQALEEPPLVEIPEASAPTKLPAKLLDEMQREMLLYLDPEGSIVRRVDNGVTWTEIHRLKVLPSAPDMAPYIRRRGFSTVSMDEILGWHLAQLDALVACGEMSKEDCEHIKSTLRVERDVDNPRFVNVSYEAPAVFRGLSAKIEFKA